MDGASLSGSVLNLAPAGATSGGVVTDSIQTFAGKKTIDINIFGGSGGSIPYQSALSTTALLANGIAGQVLTSAGTTLAPNWSSVPIALINIIYPLGAIIQSTVSTNPGSYITGTTWIAYGEGRILVGKAASGTFVTAGSVGGAETVTLIANNLPAHSHPNTLTNNTVGSSSHTHTSWLGTGTALDGSLIVAQPQSMTVVTPAAAATVTNSGAGFNVGFAAASGNALYNQTSSTPSSTTIVGITNADNITTNTPVNVLQPYIVVYTWTRTA